MKKSAAASSCLKPFWLKSCVGTSHFVTASVWFQQDGRRESWPSRCGLVDDVDATTGLARTRAGGATTAQATHEAAHGRVDWGGWQSMQRSSVRPVPAHEDLEGASKERLRSTAKDLTARLSRDAICMLSECTEALKGRLAEVRAQLMAETRLRSDGRSSRQRSRAERRLSSVTNGHGRTQTRGKRRTSAMSRSSRRMSRSWLQKNDWHVLRTCGDRSTATTTTRWARKMR